MKRSSLPHTTYLDTRYDPFHYEDILESGRDKKLKLGPKIYEWKPAGSKPSPEREAGPMLHGISNNFNPDYVERTQTTRFSPLGEGDLFLERAALEKTTYHNPPDSLCDSVRVVDQIGTRLDEDANRPLRDREGVDIQSGEDGQNLGIEETVCEKVKGSSPHTEELPREDFQPIRVIDKEGRLNPAQRNEANIVNEQAGLPKPALDITAAGHERVENAGTAVGRNLAVSTPEKQVHFLESPVSTARSNTTYQDAVLVGKDKPCTDAEVSRDVSNRLSTATGFESVHENQRNISPEAEDVEPGSDTPEHFTTASSLRSHSQDLHNENPDQLDLVLENAATILTSSSQQSGMSPILSSSSYSEDASNSIIVEDLQSDGLSSLTEKDLQYHTTSIIAFQHIRNEGQLDSTVFSSPSQQRLEGAFSSIGNGSNRPNSEDRPWRGAIPSIEDRNTELIGVATGAKSSPRTEAIEVEEPPAEKPTDESLMLPEQRQKVLVEKDNVTKPEVESSMEPKVDSSSASSAPVRNRISDTAWPKTAPYWPSSVELQRDFGPSNWQTHSLQTKEDHHKEYKSNSIKIDRNLTLNNDNEKSNSKAMTIEPTQRSTDQSPQNDTTFEDEISSRHEITSVQQENKGGLVKFLNRQEIEIIDLESECGDENEYDGVTDSQLAPIENDNTGDAPFDDDQGDKDGDSEPIFRGISHPVINRKEGADEAIGDDVIVPTVNNNNRKVDHHTDHHMEQSSIALSNPAGSGQIPAVEQCLAKDDPTLHETDSDSAGSFPSLISSLDQNISKNSANPTYETQLFTPAASQRQRSFAPELSAAIVQHPENELPTPSMTLTSTASLVLSTTPKEKTNPSFEQSNLISEESISRKAKEQSFGAPNSPSTKFSTPPPLKPSTPDEKHLVVEKLKAIRSRSTKRALARKTTDRLSSASPWFTPKEPGQFNHISDSESELESAHSSDQESPIKEDSLLPGPSPPAPTQNHRIFEPSPSGLRTTFAYYAPLSTLLSHFNNLTSVLATIHSFNAITQSTSGPRDYHQSLCLTDPSSVSCPLTLARIFRSNETAFPSVIQGDAILLRNFKVQGFQNRVSLLSTNSSAWAVFRQDTEVQVRGPPVEFGPEERSFARALWNWWASVRTEHEKREILQMPIVFIKNREGEAHKLIKDERKSKPCIIPTSVASTQNATKTHARETDVEPSPKPLAKDEETTQETPIGNRTRSISTHVTNSSPSSDLHTLRDGTSYESWPHEPSPVQEIPAQKGEHTPTRTPPTRRRNIAAIQASKLSPSSDRHVLRDGMSYESTPEKMLRRPGVNYHELRDGTIYTDDDGGGRRT